MMESTIEPVELLGIVESYISYLFSQPGMMSFELADVEVSLKEFANDIETIRDSISEEDYTNVINDINVALRMLGFEPIKQTNR